MLVMRDNERDRSLIVIRIVRVAVLYFAAVFAAGFVLGFIRVYFVIPRIGVRAAELIETPFMLAVSYAAARWLIVRFRIPYTTASRIGIGSIALALLLAAELVLVVWLQKMTVTEYIGSRDPVSGTAYLIAILLFAAFPLMVRTAERR